MRGLRRSRTKVVLLGSVVVVGAASVPARLASAFDFFGLFDTQAAPQPSPTTLPYKVDFEVKGDDAVERALEDASNLYKLRETPPPDGESLVQRATADFRPLVDAMWGAGYYNGRVSVEVAGVPLELGQDRRGAAAAAASGYRNRGTVPIKVIAETGPRFKLRDVSVVDQATGRPFDPATVPPRVLKLSPGDPARAADLRAANARLVDYFRNQSRPLVKAPLPQPVVDHATETVDVAFPVDPGPRAGIGEVSLSGPNTFDQAIVRSFIYLDRGEPYTPKALDDTRKSIAQIPAVGSVRIREGQHLDAAGNLPIFVDVTERARNLIGASAGFSTLDGPTGRAYYENRNLLGGAERLRVEGAAFFAPRNDGTRIRKVGDFKASDIGARFSFSFLKPALGGSHWDFLLDGLAERNRTGGGRFGGYTVRDAGATAGLRYRVDETLSFQGGLKYERGQTSDVLGQVNYQLIGTPLTVRYDTTDKPLDPSRGIRLTGTVTPYPTFLGSSVGFTRANASASAYYAFDEDARYILAGRVGLGSLFGAPDDISKIPSNYRFFAGGVGSIRGYRAQSVGPSGPFGFTVGGRSEFDASLEARIKVTDTIGIAPFVDAGGAYRDLVPRFSNRRGDGRERGDTRASAGLGLMYYTGIGPIRVDVAAPLNPRRGDRHLALYVSIGQSF
ncbi:MAG: BamA/TamA family outer membrane protein [Solirubrobacterales bacterium]|nr:BamA/TamA family outer membrane protein [Solirubrobacterales bacterium]